MIYNNLQTLSAVFLFPWYLSNKFLHWVWEEASDYLTEQQSGDSEGCIWSLPLCTFLIPISTAWTMLQTLGLGSSFLKLLFLQQFCKKFLILQFVSPIVLTVEAKLTRFWDTIKYFIQLGLWLRARHQPFPSFLYIWHCTDLPQFYVLSFSAGLLLRQGIRHIF